MDWLILLALPVVSALLSEIFHLPFLVSTLLFFGAPCVYLSFRRPKLIKKTVLFSALAGTFMLFIFDHMAYLDGTWFVPNSIWRFLRDSIPFEDGVWAYLWIYYVVMVWEHLFVKKPVAKPGKNHVYFYWFCGIFLSVFFGLYYWAPNLLVVPYFYAKLLIVFEIIPVLFLFAWQPSLWRRLLPFTLYFFGMSFLAELIGLRLNQWYFGGPHYLALYSLSGHVLPLDEILGWWTFAAPGMVAWYSFFWQSDSKRK